MDKIQFREEMKSRLRTFVLDLIIHSGIYNTGKTLRLYNESLELLKILASARKNCKQTIQQLSNSTNQ
ncbi:MAG: hypothetical protein EOM73_01615 [Bacteroidia bacterium]|nr:hypothetical protein [Bacteroidia bacterium]